MCFVNRVPTSWQLFSSSYEIIVFSDCLQAFYLSVLGGSGEENHKGLAFLILVLCSSQVYGGEVSTCCKLQASCKKAQQLHLKGTVLFKRRKEKQPLLLG